MSCATEQQDFSVAVAAMNTSRDTLVVAGDLLCAAAENYQQKLTDFNNAKSDFESKVQSVSDAAGSLTSCYDGCIL